jgi:hypothetical protein
MTLTRVRNDPFSRAEKIVRRETSKIGSPDNQFHKKAALGFLVQFVEG